MSQIFPITVHEIAKVNRNKSKISPRFVTDMFKIDNFLSKAPQDLPYLPPPQNCTTIQGAPEGPWLVKLYPTPPSILHNGHHIL